MVTTTWARRRSGRLETSLRGRKVGLGPAVLSPRLVWCQARARKREGKARPFPFCTLDGEIGLHCPRKVAAYRQSQPNATLPIGETLLQLDKWLENRFQVGL